MDYREAHRLLMLIEEQKALFGVEEEEEEQGAEEEDEQAEREARSPSAPPATPHPRELRTFGAEEDEEGKTAAAPRGAAEYRSDPGPPPKGMVGTAVGETEEKEEKSVSKGEKRRKKKAKMNAASSNEERHQQKSASDTEEGPADPALHETPAPSEETKAPAPSEEAKAPAPSDEAEKKASKSEKFRKQREMRKAATLEGSEGTEKTAASGSSEGGVVREASARELFEEEMLQGDKELISWVTEQAEKEKAILQTEHLGQIFVVPRAKSMRLTKLHDNGKWRVYNRIEFEAAGLDFSQEKVQKLFVTLEKAYYKKKPELAYTTVLIRMNTTLDDKPLQFVVGYVHRFTAKKTKKENEERLNNWIFVNGKGQKFFLSVESFA